MFDYGYENYMQTNIVKENDTIDTIEIKNGTKESKNMKVVIKDSIDAIVSKDLDINNISPTINLNENLRAPISAGEKVGTISYSIDDINYSSDLLAGSTVYEKTDISIYLIIAGLAILLFAIILMPKKKHSRNKYYKKRK